MRGRNVITATLAILAFANPVAATRWTMWWSRPGPAAKARGLSFGAPFHVLTDGSPPRVWPILTTGYGTPVRLNVPTGAWGLEWGESSGGWVSNYNNGYIYRVASNGSVVSSFRCPRAHPAEIAVRAVPYGDIAVALPEDNLILFLTFTGSIVRSERGPGSRVTAVSFTAGRCVGDAGTHKVYTWDGTFGVPAVAGIATDYPMSGYYDEVFITDAENNTVQYWIYSGVRPFVAPASLGRVKALFQ